MTHITFGWNIFIQKKKQKQNLVLFLNHVVNFCLNLILCELKINANLKKRGYTFCSLWPLKSTTDNAQWDELKKWK